MISLAAFILRRISTKTVLWKRMSSSNAKIVAVCQLNSTNDKAQNICDIEKLIKAAKERNATMAFFPEACDYICEHPKDTLLLSEPLDNNSVIQNLQTLSKKYDMWLSLGGIHEKIPSNVKIYNSHVILNNEGKIVSIYRKIHTFDACLSDKSISESSYVEKGKEIVPPVATPIGKIGSAVCYDIRFPELGIMLTEMGAEILTYPSAFMFETGMKHWETLLRARAIENQCYVIAAAQTGYHNENRRSWGHAMIVDPQGVICAQCSDEIGIATAEIDLKLVSETRRKMPLLSQKRFDLYPSMSPPISGELKNEYQFGQVVIDAAKVFFHSSLTFAFVNKRCVVPGHVLVSPIKVVDKFTELTHIEVADLFQTVQKIQRIMEKFHQVSSTTIVIQDGPDAGQTIRHVHVHILPRKEGDFLDNDEIYRELQNEKNSTSPWRTDEEMNTEAKRLREFICFM